jgi:hypothetical protein
MSNYIRVAWHPVERVARADAFLDNHFGHYEYGVAFNGDPNVYRPEEVEIPIDLVLAPIMQILLPCSPEKATS